MSFVGIKYCAQGNRLSAAHLAAALVVTLAADAAAAPLTAPAPAVRLERPFVVTQLPAGTTLERQAPPADGMLRAPYGDGARIVVVLPNLASRVLSQGFAAACDPEVSFDGKRVLFAGKWSATDRWNIYEMAIDGSNRRQITNNLGDCRSPIYVGTLFTLDAPSPWHQLVFVSTAGGGSCENSATAATALYSCNLDGTGVRRLTFNVSSDMDPAVMYDGRLLLASWQRARLERGPLGRVALFGLNIEGSDLALFSTDGGRRINHMPCLTTGGLAVFVEADRLPWDGAGQLSRVTLRRPLHSYRPITDPSDGLFHSPAPLPDGKILVSRRPADGSRTHGVCRLDPATGRLEPIFDDPRYHEIQAKFVKPRAEPDGRSTVVDEQDPNGRFYCLNVYVSDLKQREWMPAGTIKRLRVFEGVPRKVDPLGGPTPPADMKNVPPLAQRRILGEVPIEEDGSFQIEVPANVPIELQTLDSDGMALRSCGWIWTRNHEPRGCIGCHEDGELTPENWLAPSVTKPPIKLALPPARRRTVDFRRDMMPLIEKKCIACHAHGGAPPRLDAAAVAATPAQPSPPDAHARLVYETLMTPAQTNRPTDCVGKYIHPGRARTSPLIWHVYGRNTARPWDGAATQGEAKPIPPSSNEPLTDDDRQSLVEWIDLGALWNGIPPATADTPTPIAPKPTDREKPRGGGM